MKKFGFTALLVGLILTLAAPAFAGKPVDAGKPANGSVGNADDKNPGGQSKDDDNNGYECDNNNGVGKGNPAHTNNCGNGSGNPTTTVPTTIPTTSTTKPNEQPTTTTTKKPELPKKPPVIGGEKGEDPVDKPTATTLPISVPEENIPSATPLTPTPANLAATEIAKTGVEGELALIGISLILIGVLLMKKASTGS